MIITIQLKCIVALTHPETTIQNALESEKFLFFCNHIFETSFIAAKLIMPVQENK